MIIPPGFAAVALEMRLAGFSRSAFITYGVENEAALTDPVAIAQAQLTALSSGGGFLTQLDNSVTMASATIRLGQDGGEPLVGVATGVLTGALTSNSPSANVALLVHKRTAVGGRRNRGRFFIPWYVSEGDVGEDGVIVGTGVTAKQNAMNSWRIALGAAAFPMVVLHSVGNTAPGVPTPVSALQVDPLIATQRRRLGRR